MAATSCQWGKAVLTWRDAATLLGYHHRLATADRGGSKGHRARAVEKGTAITMVRGEPTRVFCSVQDLRKALKVADNIGLALMCLGSAADRIIGLLLLHIVDDEGEA
jgi:hypothetical protein